MKAYPSSRRVAARWIVLIALTATRVVARAVPESDVQWWQQLDITGSLPDHWSYLVTGFSRFSDADPNPALRGAGAFFTWNHGAFGYSWGYLHAQLRRPSSGDRLDADVPLVAVTGTVGAGLFTLSDRLRVEDLIGVRGNPWRYRNLVSIAASPGSRGCRESLGLSDEIFVDLTSGRLTRNRLLLGPGFALTRRIQISLDYVNERDIGARPGRIQGAFVDIVMRIQSSSR